MLRIAVIFFFATLVLGMQSVSLCWAEAASGAAVTREPVGQAEEAAKAASALLEARRKAVDDMQAGRAAPYYFAPVTAPSQQPRSRPFATGGGQKGLQ
jgi:hypothetical protein